MHTHEIKINLKKGKNKLKKPKLYTFWKGFRNLKSIIVAFFCFVFCFCFSFLSFFVQY